MNCTSISIPSICIVSLISVKPLQYNINYTLPLVSLSSVNWESMIEHVCGGCSFEINV